MGKNELCKDERYQQVLNGYGTLNWLLFKWAPDAARALRGSAEPPPH